MGDFRLKLASGWTQVAPRAGGPELLLESDGKLFHVNSDFTERKLLGPIGPVACPLAYDPRRREVYRYVCEYRAGRKDFSQIRRFNLDTGKRSQLFELPVNQWVLWLFEWVASAKTGEGQLFGLIASDLSTEDSLVLQHQLCILDPQTKEILKRPLCRDAYYPIAFSWEHRQIVFSGAEGVHLTSMKGERAGTVQLDDFAAGRGASFVPNGGPEVVIGGGGLRLWNTQNGQVSRLTQQGQFPVSTKDGQGVWYSESSSDLFYYDVGTGKSECILQMPNSRLREVSMARPPLLSQCGRYLGLPLSTKRLRGVARSTVDAGKRERVYVESHLFTVLDLESREVWARPGRVDQFRWL